MLIKISPEIQLHFHQLSLSFLLLCFCVLLPRHLSGFILQQQNPHYDVVTDIG